MLLPIPNPAHPFVQDAHFRRWGWADEQGWRRHIILPLTWGTTWVKFAENPILTREPGTVDDSIIVPCVLYVDGKYYMFYTGKDPDNVRRARLAVATNPRGPFQKIGTILDVGAAGQPDSRWVNGLQVLYDEWDPTYKWKGWYVADDGVTRRMMYARSTDPDKNWEKVGVVSIAREPWTSAVAYKLGGVYLLFYDDIATYDYLFVGCSAVPEGPFKEVAKVLATGSAGEWDDFAVSYLSFFWNLGIWYIFYSGYDGANWRIGMARHWHGLTAYDKWEKNPVLDIGSAGAWDDTFVMGPSLLMVEDTFYLYYYGCTDRNFQIGGASLP